jgi:hypothetical protein
MAVPLPCFAACISQTMGQARFFWSGVSSRQASFFAAFTASASSVSTAAASPERISASRSSSAREISSMRVVCSAVSPISGACASIRCTGVPAGVAAACSACALCAAGGAWCA